MLVTSENQLIQIDFDIEMIGPTAKELEVGQIIFYSVCGGREKVMPLLANLLTYNRGWFRPRLAEYYAIGLARHFNDNPVYGDAVDQTATVFELMWALEKKS